MFQDTKAGQTHSFGDGCGEPEHNKPEKWEKRFDSMFDLDGYGDSHIVQEKVKSFIRGVVFQREKEIAEEIKRRKR